ncbi:glycosyltransferase [Candidatus Saccharibacteria bacterium]|nr:glycosyltransferase [Candidatus Saccharibacteria bacterium]
MKKNIILSAVITAHDEGLLAHKTMQSVFAGLMKVEEAGYKYEIIVHIDNGDKATRDYFRRYKKDEKIKVFENKFRDPGSSRNYAAEKATGKYVAFLDADDLVSDNWFINAISELENSKTETIVYPEAILTFGLDLKNNVLSIQKPSYEKGKDVVIALGENRWCSVVMAKKETFIKIPYEKLGLGYSHEDYVFNIKMIEANIHQAIAKETVLFYRRSEKSRLSSSNQGHATIPYMKLFDFNSVSGLKEVLIEDFDERFRNRGYRAYKRIRNNNFLNFFITPVAKTTLRILNNRSNSTQKIPKFVLEEWKKMNKIELQLYPHKWLVNKVLLYAAENQIAVGNMYLKLVKQIKNKKFDYVFIVPWVVRGGADKVMFNYIKALHELYGWNIMIITTLPAENWWNKNLPDYVDFVDFGNKTQFLSLEQQETLFTRLIVQSRCKRLHIINSEYGYDWARKHLGLLGNNYEINTSLFCGEFIPGSDLKGVFSYDDPYLLSIYDKVKNVFTDNETIIKKTVEHNGFSEEKFKAHYQPVGDIKIVKPKNGLINKDKLRILWASRVVPTKLPNLVAEIGKGLDPKKFQIDIYGERSEEISKDIFNGIASINYKGVFNGFSSISTEKYDVLLYTALDDGIPNVILEATAAGLPIIASNDGGVGEFVKNNRTGLLIEDFLKPEAYVKVLEEILKDASRLPFYVENAQRILLSRHSWKNFVEMVKKDFF